MQSIEKSPKKVPVHFVLLAGGVGSRFGGAIPKQFIEVDNIPVIIYTLRKLRDCNVDDITIVCIEDWIPHLKRILAAYSITNVRQIVPGGASGHQSIYKGILAISGFAGDDDIIVIHDSVRPLITKQIVQDCVDKSIEFGNGCASLKIIEGLVVKDDDTHGSVVADRYNIMRIQTPQAYRYKLLKDLYDDAASKGIEYPYADGACLQNGISIYFSKSCTANIKITTKPDIAFLKAMLHFTDEELMGEE